MDSTLIHPLVFVASVIKVAQHVVGETKQIVYPVIKQVKFLSIMVFSKRVPKFVNRVILIMEPINVLHVMYHV